MAVTPVDSIRSATLTHLVGVGVREVDGERAVDLCVDEARSEDAVLEHDVGRTRWCAAAGGADPVAVDLDPAGTGLVIGQPHESPSLHECRHRRASIRLRRG